MTPAPSLAATSHDIRSDGQAGAPIPAGARARQKKFGFRLQYLLFLAFTLIAAVPVITLALWIRSDALQHELASARTRHLLAAYNLASAVSRYVEDTKSVFGLTIDSDAVNRPIAGLTNMLASLDIMQVCIVSADGRTESGIQGGTIPPTGDMAPILITELRTLAAGQPDQIALSTLHHTPQGKPVFYLVRALPAGRLAVGIISTDYLLALQQSMTLGNDGYAAIVDTRGQVIAHHLKDWVAASRDISNWPIVAAMMRGEAGTGEFFSSAFHQDMIVGYAVVRETGWGVMMSQPISDLSWQVTQWNAPIIIMIASLAWAAIIAWLVALYLARPVKIVANTVTAVLNGNNEVAVPAFHGLVPHEISQLGAAFNTMLEALRRRAAETHKALQEAETSNAAKTQFLANMSHEIRTPLNGIVGMVELMQMTELTPSLRRHVETAAQSSQVLLRLVDDILDLSRIETGRLQLVAVPFHLPSILHDVRLLFAEQARAKGLTLLTAITQEMNTVVRGDKHRLQQILTNLVGNAVKFTPEGTVTIRCSGQPEAEKRIRIRFEVTDTGIGVPADRQAVIFDAFAQGDSSMTRRYGGTGLGLSIARQLAHMMDGDIGVQSTVGVGSTFWFTVVLEHQPDTALPAVAVSGQLPVRSPAADIVIKPPAFVSPAGPEFRAALKRIGRQTVSILLVEDNPANMRITQALLETLGCQVEIAWNGVEAISVYRAHRFDLVLMDCQMPEMDGYEATRAIRQLESVLRRRIPIIALTAHAMDGSQQAALDSGMDDQITKPVTMAILTRKLLQWLTPVDASSV
ncbi:MAG TPA: ATP-binding protein [Rhodopila sp.]|nr:ATP-binding protein [Rhodopila sp.]